LKISLKQWQALPPGEPQGTGMTTKRNIRVTIFLAWLAVSIPAAWGVYNTVLNACKLFQ
jgi:hypothetical protein